MKNERSRLLSVLAGGVVAAGAASLLATWGLSVPWLAAASVSRGPQPDAAFGLAACGLGLVLATVGGTRTGVRRRVAALLGGLSLVIAIAGLLRQVAGLDAGLGSWLAAVAQHLGAEAPEAMAPNTALGLALAGAALAIGQRTPRLRSVLGAGCAALGISAVVGHATEVLPAYGWGSSTAMPPATAAGLAALGLALGLLPRPGAESADLRAWRGPLLAGLSSAVATVLFSQALTLHQERQLQRALDAGAERLHAEVRSRLDERMQALELLASLWRGRFFPNRQAWESDAELIRSQSPGLEVIEWIEPSGTADWVHPADRRLPSPDPHVLAAHRESGGAIVLGPLRLSGGRPGLRILAPFQVGDIDQGWLSGLLGDWDGWLAGVFDARTLLSDLVAPLGSSYRVRIASGDLVFYESEGGDWEPESRWTEQVSLDFPGGMRMAAWVQPSDELRQAHQSPLPTVLVAGGLLLSSLLAFGLGLANVAHERALQLEGEIAERLRAEEEVRSLNEDLEGRVRRRTRELSRSNEDLRQFAAFLSHELRQPVATQQVWAELLESRYAADLDDQGRSYLAKLRSFTNRVAESIEAQLVLFSVTDAPLHLERMDVGALVRGLVAEMKERIESHGGEIRVGDLPVVHADARLLRQLLRNLIENALNHRRPEVAPIVRIHAAASPPGEEARAEIVVEDNGRGFPTEDAERIFQPGCRLDPDQAGSGLGLTVCRRIAERHGGRLRAEGVPGSGARFRVSLPGPWGPRGPGRDVATVAGRRSSMG